MKVKSIALLAAAAASLVVSSSVLAQAKEQFIGLPSFRVGPYAAGGSGVFGGWIDYMNLINDRDGGVNGVKLTWEECETEYNNARGVECYERLKKKGATGNTVFQPVSTGITYSVLDKVAQDKIPMVTIGYGRTDAADGRVFPWVFPMITTYWSQATTMVKYIGGKEGGLDKLKGKKIVYLYHDSAFGKEGIPVLEKQAAKYGFTFKTIVGAFFVNGAHGMIGGAASIAVALQVQSRTFEVPSSQRRLSFRTGTRTTEPSTRATDATTRFCGSILTGQTTNNMSEITRYFMRR